MKIGLLFQLKKVVSKNVFHCPIILNSTDTAKRNFMIKDTLCFWQMLVFAELNFITGIEKIL